MATGRLERPGRASGAPQTVHLCDVGEPGTTRAGLGAGCVLARPAEFYVQPAFKMLRRGNHGLATPDHNHFQCFVRYQEISQN